MWTRPREKDRSYFFVTAFFRAKVYYDDLARGCGFSIWRYVSRRYVSRERVTAVFFEGDGKGNGNGKRAWWAYIHRLNNFNGMGNQNIQKGKGKGKKEKRAR